MTKLRKFVTIVFVMVLGANAGIDFTHYLQRRAVEKQIESEIVATPGLSRSKVNTCFNVRDKGWLCDITLRSNDGREVRGSKLFLYEDLAQ